MKKMVHTLTLGSLRIINHSHILGKRVLKNKIVSIALHLLPHNPPHTRIITNATKWIITNETKWT